MLNRSVVLRQRPANLIAVLAVFLLVIPLGAEAQRPRAVVTVGVLAPSAGRNPIDVAFERSLQDRGWMIDQNIRIVTRYAAGRADAFDSLAAELIGIGVDVLVAWTTPAALAATRAARGIPVVFLAVGDPVRVGLVSSLARPGGNATGVSFDVSPEIYAKRLERLKEAIPGLARVTVLISPGPLSADARTVMKAAAQALKLDVLEIEARAPGDLQAAVLRAKEQRSQALYVIMSNPFAWGGQLSNLAIAHRLPSIHMFRESVIAGGLLSYAPSLTDIASRGAAYVDTILRGAKALELPVEQPTKFDLVLNLNTARSLGLSLPPSLLLQATHVVE